MEDMSEDQLWEHAEQGVHPIVHILSKYFNWSMKEQEKRVLEITETILIEWIVSNHFASTRFPPSSITMEVVT